MNSLLLLSFRFLAPWFHGRGPDGEPEWPPSPLRVYQALVATAARAGTLDAMRPAFEWLEQKAAPLVLAPDARSSTTGYRLSVPHNAMDLVGRQWAAGKEGTPAEHRTMKEVLPRCLPDSDDLDSDLEQRIVHFAWPLTSSDDSAHTDALIGIARNVVALGWGVDLVVGNGAIIEKARLVELTGESTRLWEPKSDGRNPLRSPTAGTLDDLSRRHQAFLNRTAFADPTLRPPPPLSTFAPTRYRRADEPSRQRVAAFTLMNPHTDRMRGFDTARRGVIVAGMLRHAVRLAAERAGWSDERVNGTVLGHGDTSDPRLLLVPLPSIEQRPGEGKIVTAVRRVLVLSTDSSSQDVSWAERALGGVELVDEKTRRPVALLAVASTNDQALKRYRDQATMWATVTPVVLPGLDDPGGLRERLDRARNVSEQKNLLARLARRREGLVRKALRHAGFSDELVFDTQIETREVGFFAGVELASRYAVPRHLAAFPRLHVRLTWPRPVPGPLCIGRGRFSGLGLFASMRKELEALTANS